MAGQLPEELRNPRRLLLRNTAGIVLARVGTAAAGLLLIPFVVRKLGMAGYGTWEAMTAVSSLSLMFQGAITATMVWWASAAFGEGDRPRIHRTARLGLTATGVVFAVVVPLVWITRGWLVRFLNVPSSLRSDAEVILPLLVSVTILSGIPESLGAVVTAYQRVGIATLSNALGVLVNYSVVLFCLTRGAGLWSLFLGLAAALLANSACLYGIVWKLSGPLRFVPTLPTVSELRAMGSYGSLILVGFVSASLRDQLDRLILASMATPLWVGYYSLAARLAGLILEVTRFIYVPMVASIAALRSAGHWETIRRLYTTMMRTGALATGAIAVVVAALCDRLLVLWIGKPVVEAVPIVIMLIAGNTTAAILTGPGSALCRAIGRVEIETAYVLVGLTANAILTVLLVLLVGPLGTVMASAVTWAGASVFFVVWLHKKVDLPREGILKAVRTLAAVVLVGAIVWGATRGMAGSVNRLAAVWSLLWLVPMTLIAYGGVALILGGVRIAELQRIIQRRTRTVREGAGTAAATREEAES